MPAMAAHYITFLAKYVPSSPHQPTAVFLGGNSKDAHYLSGIYGIYTIPAQKSVLSPKYEKPDTGQQTPDTGNSKSEIFCAYRSPTQRRSTSRKRSSRSKGKLTMRKRSGGSYRGEHLIALNQHANDDHALTTQEITHF